MTASNATTTTPFFHTLPTAQPDTLAILHLKRDLLIPTVLRTHDTQNEGYSEGKVTNTRFGSFPHSTLIGVPWGSQVRASVVDTGSRGRQGWEGKGKGKGKKRKRGDEGGKAKDVGEDVKKEQGGLVEPKVATEAATGFVHLLPPTPEIWTASLPHRTQVVYTPDYSYILHRTRARPGTALIEAGAGSGSFTHAAARAVYNGHSTQVHEGIGIQNLKRRRQGKIYSFEFHEQRAVKLEEELKEHGLDGIVELTYRDVCADGFVPNDEASLDMQVNSIFLDLPAPWLALKHLSRSPSASGSLQPSPLDPFTSVHLCTFSPCIEQVTRTISTLRSLGWTDIEMVEVAAKRFEVRRERVGLQEEGLRGVNDSPADADEALTRLREFEGRSRVFHEESVKSGKELPVQHVSKQQRLGNIRNAQEGRKLYKEGRLIHKAEPELKTHTSYLVFAILPREWSEEDELKAQQQWPDRVDVSDQSNAPMGKKARKQAAKAKAGGNKAFENASEGGKEVDPP